MIVQSHHALRIKLLISYKKIIKDQFYIYHYLIYIFINILNKVIKLFLLIKKRFLWHHHQN